MAQSGNQLRQARSPYLLQHADNPVAWRPWGEAALAEARVSGRPILLSIGYAACHWCHVMAHESFEDPAIAALINQAFVAIKVDREERPDIDHLYMQALHAMGEQGGWPLTMFLTPDGAPFWGGTYFPPEPRWGKPSFRQVLEALARALESSYHPLDKRKLLGCRRGGGRDISTSWQAVWRMIRRSIFPPISLFAATGGPVAIRAAVARPRGQSGCAII